MKLNVDLFGHPLPQPTAYRKDGGLRKGGYAARPGSGPRNQRCNTCRHCTLVQHAGVRSHKCQLIAARWTYDANTDINQRAPACRDWQRKIYAKDGKEVV